MPIKNRHMLAEIGQATGQSVELVDHDDIDSTGFNICHQPMQQRAF